MGLDSYIEAVHVEALQGASVDFYIDRNKYAEKEFAYFRKNSALHSFMWKLYERLGGTDKEFNGNNVVVLQRAVMQLKHTLEQDELTGQSGFFWGSMEAHKYEDIREFVEKALEFYRSKETEGYVLYYTSSW